MKVAKNKNGNFPGKTWSILNHTNGFKWIEIGFKTQSNHEDENR